MKELLLKYSLLNTLEKAEVQVFIDFLLSKRKQKTAPPVRKTLPVVSVWEADDFYTAVRQNDRPVSTW
jgi:ABC-type thiamine transport system substrate-binding protein